MNRFTESEMQTLERLEPREFYQAIMQIVAGGLTAWRNESARPSSTSRTDISGRQPAVVPTVASNATEAVETMV